MIALIGTPYEHQVHLLFRFLKKMALNFFSMAHYLGGRGQSTGTRRGKIVALSLLGWEFFKARNVPPVTLSLICMQVAIFLRLFNFMQFVRLKGVCLSYYYVVEKSQYRRLILGTLVHADEWHLYYNMASLMWKGKTLEKRLGCRYYAYLTLAFIIFTSGTYVLLNFILSEFFEDDSYIFHCAVGFSGVLFAMKVLTTYIEPPSTSLLLGFIPISSKWACWAELILIQILVPHTSFTGHLAGILVGLAFTRGPLKRIMDIPFLSLFGFVPVVHGYDQDDRSYQTFSRSSSQTSRQYSRQPSAPGSVRSERTSTGASVPPSTAGDFDHISEDDEDASNLSDRSDMDLNELRRRRAQRFT